MCEKERERETLNEVCGPERVVVKKSCEWTETQKKEEKLVKRTGSGSSSRRRKRGEEEEKGAC